MGQYDMEAHTPITLSTYSLYVCPVQWWPGHVKYLHYLKYNKYSHIHYSANWEYVTYCKQCHKNFKPYKLSHMPSHNHDAETNLHKPSKKNMWLYFHHTVLTNGNFEQWMEVCPENIIKAFQLDNHETRPFVSPRLFAVAVS
jgi:hypothetical protein